MDIDSDQEYRIHYGTSYPQISKDTDGINLEDEHTLEGRANPSYICIRT